jgi:exocyst complex component 4
MSRVPPFSARDLNRTRNAAPSSYSASASAYDSRPQSIVSDISGADVRNSNIPTRPSRSQLRGIPGGSETRVVTSGLGDASRGGTGMPPPATRTRPLRRDSESTTFSDKETSSPAVRRDWNRGAMTDVDTSRRGNASPTAMSPSETTSPKALAAITAFQSAGQRRARRQATLESPVTGGQSSAPFSSPGGFGSYEETEREENERRRREERRHDEERRERMIGRQKDRQKGGGRGRGDIDAVLDQVQGEWEFVTKPDVGLSSLSFFGCRGH